MSHPLFDKRRIFAPGPTPVPEEALQALSASPLHHRTKEFEQILDRTKQGLQFLFQTEQPAYIQAASGTGAMETIIVNLFSPGDRVLVVNGGKFGERWGKISKAYGLTVDIIEVPWGSAVEVAQVVSALKKNSDTRGVLFQASETSTAVYHPVKELAEAIRQNSDALIVVDAITALGVTEMPMDAWGLDAVVSGSQKALMLPPGLAFLALSKKAQERRKAHKGIPRFYFNLDAEDKVAATHQTAWTPAVGLIMALDVILKRFKAVGLEKVFSHHKKLAHATRTGLTAMGLELFAKDSPSPAVTAALVPKEIPEGKKIVSQLRDKFGITIAGGQDAWTGKIFRIGHLGFYDELDVLTILSAVEVTLKRLGYPAQLGKGVGAAEAYFLECDK